MSKKMKSMTALNHQTVAVTTRTLLAAAMVFGFNAHSWADTVIFSNTNAIVINDLGNPPTVADTYPSSISVSGLAEQSISHLTVTLSGLTHTFPSDLNIVLAGPSGQLAMLMSEAGGTEKFPVSNLTLTLDDSAADPLPLDSTLVSGVFKPTRQMPTLAFEFPSPAPAGSSDAPAALSVFNGTNPNGTWTLFVVDESSPDSGTIAFGWSMNITSVPEPGTVGFATLILGCGLTIRMRRGNVERNRS